MVRFVSGLLVIAAAATVGDFIWYTFGVQHRMVAGLLHGAALLTVVGGVLGAASGRPIKGLPIGTLAGLGGAASYYAIIAMTGGRTYGAAIPASWVILWIMLAALDGRWLRAPARRSWTSVIARGTLAALAGGVAFYLVMNILWGRPPAGGRNYLVQLLAWAFAWAPGLMALTMGRPGRSSATGAAGGTSGVTPPKSASPLSASDAEGSISGAELAERLSRGEAPHILDVRSEREFEAGHVPGAVNVPFNHVSARMDEVPGASGDELIVYCGHGPRAYMAAVALGRSGGRRVVFLSGHWSTWEGAGLPVQTGDRPLTPGI